MQKTHIIIATTLLLAACGEKPEKHGSLENAVIEDTVENAARGIPPSANGSTENLADDSPGPAPAAPSSTANAIPVGFHGRWGMVPGDCGSDASIAKGLMVIDGAKLRFYESVGKPAVVNFPTPSRMEGRFTFTGEGMEWGKDMTLTLQGGGKLVRAEKDPAASYTYTQCKG